MKTLLILFLGINISYGQCTFQKNTTDEFTGAKILAIRAMNVGKFGSSADYAILSVDKSIVLLLQYSYGAECNVYEGDALMLKTEDSVITLKATGNASSDYNIKSNLYDTKIMYHVSQEELEYLRDHPISKVRVYHSKGHRDLMWKEGSKDFLNIVACFLQEFIKI